MAGEWGIFNQNGGTVLRADAVASVEYTHDYRVSDYPQEKGAFESYNKVQVPFQGKVTFIVSTSRRDFLQSLETAEASLDLFVLATPDASYPSVNLVHFGYRRSQQQGTTMMLVDVWVEEIRIVSGAELLNTTTQSVNGTDSQQNGAVQSQPDGPGGSTNLQSNLNISNIPNGPPTSLPSPNVGPAFFDATNLPKVPNTWDQLTVPQQSSVISLTGGGVKSAFVSPPSTVLDDVVVQSN